MTIENQNNYGVALYYPFINVQDIDWLKSALLYWDNIRCITPSPGYFKDEINYLFEEGIIIATSPNDYSRDTSLKFVKKIQKYCTDQGMLDAKARDYLEKQYPELKDVSIHDEKFNEKIFHEMGLKVILGHFENGVSHFYHAQPYISALYMLLLAAEMSKAINAPMLTDIPGLFDLGQHILWSDDIITKKIDLNGFLMQLNIEYPSSDDLAKLSFNDIIQFRQKRNDERRRFRATIEEIRSVAQRIDDPNALADFLNDKKQTIQQAISNHRKSLSDIGIKNFTSSIKAVWPSLFGIAIGQIAGGITGILSTIGIAGISIVANQISIAQERQKAIKECDWHYLINLEEELK